MRTLSGRLDTKISIIMNVFHAHFEFSICAVARERWKEWRMEDGRWDGGGVYKRVLCG